MGITQKKGRDREAVRGKGKNSWCFIIGEFRKKTAGRKSICVLPTFVAKNLSIKTFLMYFWCYFFLLQCTYRNGRLASKRIFIFLPLPAYTVGRISSSFWNTLRSTEECDINHAYLQRPHGFSLSRSPINFTEQTDVKKQTEIQQSC